jgi:hypothetical protein
MANGDIVRINGQYTSQWNQQVWMNPCFLIILGQACHIPDEDTAESLFGPSWQSRITIVDTLPAPEGPPFTSGSCLVSVAGWPPGQPPTNQSLYLFTWGLLFFVSSGNAWINYGFSNGTTNPVAQNVINVMPAGFTITE